MNTEKDQEISPNQDRSDSCRKLNENFAKALEMYISEWSSNYATAYMKLNELVHTARILGLTINLISETKSYDIPPIGIEERKMNGEYGLRFWPGEFNDYSGSNPYVSITQKVPRNYESKNYSEEEVYRLDPHEIVKICVI